MHRKGQAVAPALLLVVTLASVAALSSAASAPVIQKRPSTEAAASLQPGRKDQKTTEVVKERETPKEPVFNEELQSIKLKDTPGGNLLLSRPSIYANGTGKKIATVEFWDKLAHCETHSDWENPGRYAGGLGIYVGTWRQWGGTQFAETPSKATKSEQIVVANRISTQGWMREDGRFQKPVWFTGWGALACAGRPELVSLKDQSAYTLEQSRTTP
jgi:hypothetical protein